MESEFRRAGLLLIWLVIVSMDSGTVSAESGVYDDLPGKLYRETEYHQHHSRRHDVIVVAYCRCKQTSLLSSLYSSIIVVGLKHNKHNNGGRRRVTDLSVSKSSVR